MQGLGRTEEKPPKQEQEEQEKEQEETEKEQDDRSPPRPNAPNKNTIDLQWIIDTICNVRPCKDGRNAATATTMGSNEKTMRRTMGTMKNSGGPYARL